MTMLAPWRASSRTIAWPIPLLPPVTIATLFFSDMIRVLDDYCAARAAFLTPEPAQPPPVPSA
jgi:hypothetical protein